VSSPWLNSYPEGVPAEIDLGEYRSIIEILEQSCSRNKNQAAFVNFGTTLTYTELDIQTRNFAAWLQSKGLEKGDRIALVMPNILQYPVALFGAIRAGLVVVNTNPMYTAREMKHQLVDSGARAIVIVENVAHVLTEISSENPVEFVITTRIGDMLNFPKGLLFNFVMKYVKKEVPEWSLPGSVSFTEALREGKNLQFEKVDLGHRTATWWPICSNPGTGWGQRASVRASKPSLPRCRFTISLPSPRTASCSWLWAAPIY